MTVNPQEHQYFQRYDLTDSARHVIELAHELATRRDEGRNFVLPSDLLFAVVAMRHGVASYVLESFGITVRTFGADVAEVLAATHVSSIPKYSQPSRDVERLLLYAKEEATLLGHHYTGAQHILLALCRIQSEDVNEIFDSLNIDPADVMKECVNVVRGDIRRWIENHPEIDLQNGVELY